MVDVAAVRFLFRHWRVLLLLVLVVVAMVVAKRLDALEQRVADRDREIVLLRAAVSEKEAVLQEVARQSAQRMEAARQAVEQARGAADKYRAEAERLRKIPRTGEECEAARDLLREYLPGALP